MSQYKVSDILSALEGKLHDQSLDKLSGNVLDKVDEAARNLLLEFDLKETKTYKTLEPVVFPSVNRYLCPSDMKGDSIVTIRKIQESDRNLGDRFSKTSEQEVSLGRNEYEFVVDYVNGTKFLKMNIPSTDSALLISEFESADNVTVSGSISNPTVDDVSYISGSSSVKFTLKKDDIVGDVRLDLTTPSSIADYITGRPFAWFNLPKESTNDNATPITKIKMVIGNSDLDYYEVSATRPQDSTAFYSGFNLVSFDFSKAVVTGTPGTTVNFIKFSFEYPTQTSDLLVNIDQVTFRNGSSYEIGFYSQNLFKDAITGALKDKPTSEDDILLLSKESVNLLLYELCEITAQELQAEDATVDVKYWEKRKKEVFQKYKLAFPSETIKKTMSYYRIRRR